MAESEQVDKLVNEMLTTNENPADFVINGIHFGRGDAYYNSSTRNKQKHATLGLKIWKILNEQLELISNNLNQFNANDTYLIEWHSKSETFQLDTDNLLASHDNRIYFYWRGSSAPKGQSPLPENIPEDTPVERIVQWSEPPVFLRLFSGTFVVHDTKDPTNPGLYILRGEIENEAHLFQIPATRSSLRSRTSFVLHVPQKQETIVWHGSESNSQCKKIIRGISEKIFGKFAEVFEGSETTLFLDVLGGCYDDYFSLLNEPSKVINYTPKLFYLTNVTGELWACRVENCLGSVHTTPFPFLQTHLYSAMPPAMFLLDDHDEIWVWYGWMKNEEEQYKKEHDFTRSFAINYAKLQRKDKKNAIMVREVYHKNESLNFTNLFPIWDGPTYENANTIIEIVALE